MRTLEGETRREVERKGYERIGKTTRKREIKRGGASDDEADGRSDVFPGYRGDHQGSAAGV